ncbi:unnamed protein product [Ixodes pacificus]
MMHVRGFDQWRYIFRCLYKPLLAVNALLQVSHLYGFSPV